MGMMKQIESLDKSKSNSGGIPTSKLRHEIEKADILPVLKG